MNKKGNAAKVVIGAALIMVILSVVLMGLEAIRSKNDQNMDIYPENIHLIQLEEPAEGAPTATIETTLGSFSIVLYPEQSPQAVKNFTELAESGYYDGTYIFNSESGAYSAGGSQQKNGAIPEGGDTSHEMIPRELSQDLWPFRGAVCVLNTTIDRTFKEKIVGGGRYYNGSRLAFINTIEITDEYKEQLLAGEGAEVGKAFVEKGGIPNFSQQMTIIGQTYEGLDVIEALSRLETKDNGVYKIPKDDVKIISVKLGTYSKK